MTPVENGEVFKSFGYLGAFFLAWLTLAWFVVPLFTLYMVVSSWLQ